MVRIAAVFIVIGGIVTAGSAAAQFSIFGNSPPVPPADVPGGASAPQQSAPGYPSQAAPSYPAYPGPASEASPAQPMPAYSAAPPPSSPVQSQPLPPPPGATTVAPTVASPQPYLTQPGSPQPSAQPAGSAPPYPPQPGPAVEHALATPPQANPAPGNPQAPPAQTAEAPPVSDIVVEKPTAHIANKEAVFVGLDKITGRTIKFDAAIGETVQFGALQVTPRACYTRPPTEATNTDAFVEVDEVTLKGAIKRIFTGWMFASSPGLNAVEHPIYDVWLIDCASPIETTEADTAAHTTREPGRGRVRAPARRGAPPAQ
jgi:hypothetical protein